MYNFNFKSWLKKHLFPTPVFLKEAAKSSVHKVVYQKWGGEEAYFLFLHIFVPQIGGLK